MFDRYLSRRDEERRRLPVRVSGVSSCIHPRYTTPLVVARLLARVAVRVSASRRAEQTEATL